MPDKFNELPEKDWEMLGLSCCFSAGLGWLTQVVKFSPNDCTAVSHLSSIEILAERTPKSLSNLRF